VRPSIRCCVRCVLSIRCCVQWHQVCGVVGWLRPDLRLTFQRQVRQTHRTHRTQANIFADVALAIFYSMADYCTAGPRILLLFAEVFWARRQLSNGIRYVSVGSELMNSLSSVEGALCIKLAIFYLMADYSTAAGRILMPFVGGCWP